MPVLNPKYALPRKITLLMWAGGMIFWLMQWFSWAVDPAIPLLERQGATAWLQAAMQQANQGFPIVAHANVLIIYVTRAIWPAVLATHGWPIMAALPALLTGWTALMWWGFYPRFRQRWDERFTHPAAGRWAATAEVVQRFAPREGQPSLYIGTYRPRERFKKALASVANGGGRELHIPFNLLAENAVVIGGVGAGKTWGVLIPMIISGSDQPNVSMVGVDIKFGEMDCLTTAARTWMETGTVAVWNPWDPDSVRVDILQGISADSEDVWEHVAILMGHTPIQVSDEMKFWSASEAVVLETLIRSALLEGKHMDRVRELSFMTPERLHEHVALLPDPELRRKLDRFFGLGYEKQAGSLYGLEKYLRDWDNPTVVRATTAGDLDETLDLRRLMREHMLFIIGIPQEKFVSGHALVLFRLMMKTLTKVLLSARADDERQKVVLVLEEFAQLERIPYFSQFLRSCRSRDVATVVTMQGVHDGYAMYGRDTFTGLLNNMRTRMLFMGSLGDEEAQYFSQLMGHQTSDSFSWGETEDGARLQVVERPLPMVAAEEMAWKWPLHSVAVRTGGIPPFVAHCPPAITLPRFRSKLLAAAPPDATVVRPHDRSMDVKPPGMPELLTHYRKRTLAALLEGTLRRDVPLRAPSANGDGAASCAAVAVEPAAPARPTASERMRVVDLPKLVVKAPRARPKATLAETLPLFSGTGADSGASAEAVSDHAEPAAGDPGRDATPPAGRPAAAISLGAMGAEELVTRIAQGLLELHDKEPSAVAAVEVVLTRDRKVLEMKVPRGALERIFGSGFDESFRKWVQELHWLKPMVGERARVTRTLCHVLADSLQQALARRFVYGRRGDDLDVRPASAGKAPSAEAARKFGELCAWVAAHASRMAGHPAFRGGEADGHWGDGDSVKVLPHVVHKVIGGTQETNWPLWRQWADAGWIAVDPKRLTKTLQWDGKERRRVVWIVWEAYKRAASGEAPPVLTLGDKSA
jgi:hypothetical protein